MQESLSRRFEQGFARTRQRIDQGLEHWGYWVYDHAWFLLAACALVLGLLITQVPRMVVDTSTEGFLHENDPFRTTYNEFRFQFGRDERVLVLIDSGEGKDIFNASALKKLRDLHQDLEQHVPKLQHIDSLINARLTRGENDQLIVQDFLEDSPQTDAEIAVIKQRALANELYVNQFISRDGRYAAIVIENDAYSSLATNENSLDETVAGFDEASTTYSATEHPPFLTGEENTEIVTVIDAIIKKYDGEGFRVQQSGTPQMVDRLTRIMMQDMTKFIFLSLAIVATLLLVIFRRWVMVFLPIAVSMLAMMATMGIMAYVGIHMTAAAQIMPSFLLTIGVANAVHIFVIFSQRSKLRDSKRDALAHALGHSGLAIMMTSFTTIAGLLSFSQSDVKPIADFGIITPIGVLNSMLCALILLPALIAVLPIKDYDKVEDHMEGWSQRLMMYCGGISVRHPWKIVCIWGVLVLISLVLALQMRFSHNPLTWFQKEDPFRVGMEVINKSMGGGIALEIIFDTHKPDGVKDPEFLKRLDAIQQFTLNNTHHNVEINKAVSMVDVVKEINQALHNNDPAYYSIPDDKELLAQEILLFENSGSDDLQLLTDGQFSKARLTLKMQFGDAVTYPPFIADYMPKLREIMGDKATIKETGVLAMMGSTFYNLMVSQAESYISSVFFITAMMILFVGSWRIGLLSMVPNISPIIITLGLMVLLNYPLDAFNLLIGSIGLGLAVDDTIHFMNTYQRNFHTMRDPEKAVMHTMSTAGEAMFFTCTILSSAFFVYIFSTMLNLQIFGILTGCCILIAASADAFLNPALMYLYGKRQLKLQQQSLALRNDYVPEI